MQSYQYSTRTIASKAINSNSVDAPPRVAATHPVRTLLAIPIDTQYDQPVS